ncbi:hypothetical protein JW979_04950 [bacterium]|nr:hypothetical protein [candidate division CSSED10-310 bacterium]
MVLSFGVGQSVSGCLSWAQQFGLTHPVLADTNRTVYYAFSPGPTHYVPHNAVLDCDFVVLYTAVGYYEAQVMAAITSGLEDTIGAVHTPLTDTENTADPLIFDASFDTTSPFVSGYPVLAYNMDGSGSYTEIAMSPTRWTAYSAQLPAQPDGTDIYYYIDLRNQVGCDRTLPAKAPDNRYSFHVGADLIPPMITHDPLTEYAETYWPATIQAEITDNIGVDSATLEFRINGGAFSQIPMTERGIYEATFTGEVVTGDVVEYRIIATDLAQNPNTAYHPDEGYHTLNVIDALDAYIIDLDPAHNSGPVIRDDLQNLGFTVSYTTELPSTLLAYNSIFVCLGVYSQNHVLNQTEGDFLKTFLDSGGSAYMEGGDTWAWDTQTSFHGYFSINGTSDGSGDAGPVNGIDGTFTRDLHYNYQTDSSFNSYIDHLSPIGDAFSILQNGNPVYYNGIAYDGRTYKTVGTSIKYGGLYQQPSGASPSALLEGIMEFFEIIPDIPTQTPTIPVPTDTPQPPTATPGGPTETPQPPTSTPSEPTETPLPSTPTPVSPTNTAIPSWTPTEPTETPTPHPPTATASPTAVPTDVATATETPYPDPYIKINMNQTDFTAGDPFQLNVTVYNPLGAVQINEFIVLDIFSLSYFFWPSWTETADWNTVNLSEGYFATSTIFDFTWPENVGAADNLRFWTAMIKPDTGALYGSYDMVEWQYH